MSSKIRPLSPDQLYTYCDFSTFSFNSTDDIDAIVQTVGQEKAVDAIKFGVSIQHEGYNIFVLGSPGSGKYTTSIALLNEKIKDLPQPDDWCYVYNFDQPHKPKALSLAHGEAALFAHEMEQLIEELLHTISAVFTSDDYQAQIHALEQQFKDREDEAIESIRSQARDKEIALLRTTGGFAFAAIHEGEVLKPKDYEKLTEANREQIESDITELQKELHKVINQIPQWRSETREKIKQLIRQVATEVVSYPIAQLKKRYSGLKKVINYLDRVQEDIIDNIDEFRSEEEAGLAMQSASRFDMSHSSPLYRYQVNVVSSNGLEAAGAPVVYEDHPTYQNLVGRIEHIAMMGALITDFRLIKPGALHRANQGFLVLDAYKILSHPYAWDGLKRALQSKEIRIQSLEQLLSLVSTVSLEPECIPLNTKVVLLGDRYLYYLLYQLDPEFCELFKVAADFDESIERIPENTHQYVNLIATLTKKHKLRGLLPEAVGRVIEECSRSVEDSEKLSTHLRGIADLLMEADYWAENSGNKHVSKQDVEKAISAREVRSSRIKLLHLDSIKRDIHLIDIQGERSGVVNGLSVISLGDIEFGTPTRITASVRMGEGEVVNIEREVELSGPIHSKGVFILSSYLAAHYATDYPLSVMANLVFEQSYGVVDGDSASSAELIALLSALANVPIKQNIAVTGSVNQLGEVQAIGGVNYKIEGFFDVCTAKGLTGDQGVLIPHANVKHLMLREDVIQAAKQKQFHIYTMKSINEGIEVLTGLKAGERNDEESYPEETVNDLVEQRLIAMAKCRHDFSSTHKEDSESDNDG